MKTPILRKQICDFRISVYYSKWGLNPRIDWDNVSHMVVDRRYVKTENSEIEQTLIELCEKYDIECEDMDCLEMIKALDKFIVIKPISIYEHSGATVFFGAPTCRWDSSYIGFGYMEHEDLHNEMCGRNRKDYPNWRDQCEAVLNAEMDDFDRYVRGEVYDWMAEIYDEDTRNWEYYDSRCGYIKSAEDVINDALLELPSWMNVRVTETELAEIA